MHASVTSSNGGFLTETSDEILRGFIPILLTFASHSIRSKRTGFHAAPPRITGAANTSPTEPLTHPPCHQNSAVPSLLRTLQLLLVTRNANHTPKPQCKTRLRNIYSSPCHPKFTLPKLPALKSASEFIHKTEWSSSQIGSQRLPKLPSLSLRNLHTLTQLLNSTEPTLSSHLHWVKLYDI